MTEMTEDEKMIRYLIECLGEYVLRDDAEEYSADMPIHLRPFCMSFHMIIAYRDYIASGMSFENYLFAIGAERPEKWVKAWDQIDKARQGRDKDETESE